MMSRLFCVSVVLASAVLLAAGVNGATIEGRWSGEQGTVVYTQDGNAVTGEATFPNGQTAKLVGVMIGDKVYYSFTRDTGEFGTGVMTVSEDGKTLESTYAEMGTGISGTWRITRDTAGGTPPAAKSQLAGRWNSNLGETVFEQSGTKATGKLTMVNGHTANITGGLRGREFAFTFQLDAGGGGGDGRLVLSPDGMVLSGTYTKTPDNIKGDWVLVRPGPVPCGEPSLPAAANP
jgi:hypothetical protein